MKIFTLVMTTLAFFPLSSRADSEPVGGMGGGTHGMRGFHGVKMSGANAKAGGGNQIKGSCGIMQSASNPLAGPCVNLVLVLNHPDGTEAFKTRTDPQGRFSFESVAGQDYILVPGSKFYDLVSPKGQIAAGNSRVDVQLQQK